MRNFKKFLTLVLAVMMVVSAMSFTTSAAKFNDVDAKNEVLADAVDLLNYMGVAQGVSDTEFGTEQAVTRQQFALFMYRLVKGGKDAPKGPNTTNFTDLVDETYNYAIGWAASKGIVNGTSDTTFNPTGNITLQDAYTMVVRALDYETEETLPYPYGYIEVAEDNGVELDNGLNSSIGYTDVLTRGDMAIILYNAFFAKTGVAEKITYYKEFKTEYEGEYFVNVVSVTEDDYPRLCEKYFNIMEVEYQATATPHYALAGETVTDELGYDAIYFEMTENGKVNTDRVKDALTSAAYLTPEQINVAEEELDNYFLANFTMFVTADSNGEIEKVLYAGTDFAKKTVNDLKFEEVASNKADSYFEDTETKLLTGKATTGTEEIYFFNAPYSYAKPNYELASTPEDQYAARNALNIKTIDVEAIDTDKNYYEATIDEFAVPSEYSEDGYADYAKELIKGFEQAYLGGLYEAVLYDVEGDGIYDYIDYDPYSIFYVNTSASHKFATNVMADRNAVVPSIYTNGATVTGETFKNGDLVIGHYDEHQNYIKVAHVLTAAEATVKSIKPNTNTIVFTDGTTAKVDAAWKLVANYDEDGLALDAEAAAQTFLDNNDQFANLLTAAAFDEAVKYYIYDGVILAVKNVAPVSTNIKYAGNLIIPVADKNGKMMSSEFNTKTGEFEYYVHVWVDGTTKYVPVETDEVYPAIIDGEEVTAQYLNKLCTYSVDADGIYTITSLGYAEDEDGEFIGITDDEDALKATTANLQQYNEVEFTTLEKVAPNRFSMDDKLVNITADTKIVVKNTITEDNQIKYVVLDKTTLTDTVVDADGNPAEIANVSYILSNNTSSATRENLLVLYFEVEDLELEAETNKNAYRIISTSRPAIDDEGTFRYVYEVYNPFTATKEEVPGATAKTKASQLPAPAVTGTIVKLADGKVDERDDIFGTLNPFFNANYTSDLEEGLQFVWITGYDAETGTLEVVNVEDTLSATNKSEFDAIMDEQASAPTFIDVDAATALSFLKHTGTTVDAYNKSASIAAFTINDIAAAKNEHKAYNGTKYAQYLKALVKTTDGRSDENAYADFIIVLANANENAAFLK